MLVTRGLVEGGRERKPGLFRIGALGKPAVSTHWFTLLQWPSTSDHSDRAGPVQAEGIPREGNVSQVGSADLTGVSGVGAGQSLEAQGPQASD